MDLGVDVEVTLERSWHAVALGSVESSCCAFLECS